MKSSTILHEISPDEITSCFHSIQKEIKDLRENLQPKEPTEFLTRNELAELLKCDISTIHNWTKRRILKAYGIGNRVLYKRNEIESMLIPLNGDFKGGQDE
jgi:excisionase family DNA binding protein